MTDAAVQASARSVRSGRLRTASLALAAASVWASRMTRAAPLTWADSGRANLTMASAAAGARLLL